MFLEAFLLLSLTIPFFLMNTVNPSPQEAATAEDDVGETSEAGADEAGGEDPYADLMGETDKLLGGEPPIAGEEDDTPADEDTPVQGDDPKTEAKKEEKGGDGDDAGLVEVEGEKYYYHPSEHAKGEKTHPNAYKTHEAAVHAAVAKAGVMKEKIDKLKEMGKSSSTLGLPKALADDLTRLEKIADYDDVVQMNDGDLRTFLKEADQYNMRADDKIERESKAAEANRQTHEITEAYEKSLDKAEEWANTLGIMKEIDQLKTPEAVLKAVTERIEHKIAGELKKDVEALEAFQNDDDKAADMGAKAFSAEIRSRMDAIEARRSELQGQYGEGKQAFEDFLDASTKKLESESAKESELTPVQEASRRAAAFKEFGQDMKDRLPMYQNKKIEEVKAFTSYAITHKEDFNKLQTTDDVVQAHTAWKKHVEDKIAKYRAGKLESENKKDEWKNDINSPAKDQARLKRGNDTSEDEYEAELEELEAETNKLYK